MKTPQSIESVERRLSIGFAFCQINITPAMDNVHWVRESFSAFKAKKGQGGSAELINAKQKCVSSPRFFRLQVLLEALWPVVDLFLGRRRGSLWREFPLSVFSDERNRCFQRKVIPSWFYNFNAKWFPVDFTISTRSESRSILQHPFQGPSQWKLLSSKFSNKSDFCDDSALWYLVTKRTARIWC